MGVYEIRILVTGATQLSRKPAYIFIISEPGNDQPT